MPKIIAPVRETAHFSAGAAVGASADRLLSGLLSREISGERHSWGRKKLKVSSV